MTPLLAAFAAEMASAILAVLLAQRRPAHRPAAVAHACPRRGRRLQGHDPQALLPRTFKAV